MAILSGGRLARGLVYHIERTAVFSRRVSQDEYSCYKHSEFQPDSMDNQHVRKTADPLLSPRVWVHGWMWPEEGEEITLHSRAQHHANTTPEWKATREMQWDGSGDHA